MVWRSKQKIFFNNSGKEEQINLKYFLNISIKPLCNSEIPKTESQLNSYTALEYE